MKSLLMVVLLLNAAAFAQTVEGEYFQKTCSKFEVSDKSVPADLVIEIQKSKSFIITKNSVGYIIDGDTKYWNREPIVFIQSGEYGMSSLKVKSHLGDDRHFKVYYVIETDFGLDKSKDKFEILMRKNSDGSLSFELEHKYKNAITLGFWKKSAEIECVFR